MALVHALRRLLPLVSITLIAGLSARAAEAQGGARPAAAQPLDPVKKAEAKRSFDQGADLYAQGSYEEAIAAWEKAFEISGHPLIFESVANAQERLGRPREAKVSLMKWRAAAPAEEHALLDRRIANLDERIATLEEEEAAAAERARQEEARERAGVAGSGSGAEDAAEEPGSPLVPIGFVVGGVGIGAIVGGLVVGAIAAGKRPDETAACRGSDGGSLCMAAERDAIESSASLALVSDLLWIGGAVATATGAVLVVVGSSSDAAASGSAASDQPRATLVPSLGPAGGGATLRGVW